MRCRGRKAREQIVKDYRVVPVAHIKLLAGQTKRSDAEADITNEYYIFEAIHSTKKKEIIQCGMRAARHFLELLNHEKLPLFNPLHNDGNGGGHGGASGDVNQGRNWNPIARQLYNAIMWLIIAWDAKPDTPLFKLRAEIIECYNREPCDHKIKSVNTIIQNGGKGRTLSEIINDFRGENNIRDDMCQFDLLSSKIVNMRGKDGNLLNLQSFF